MAFLITDSQTLRTNQAAYSRPVLQPSVRSHECGAHTMAMHACTSAASLRER